MNFLVGIFRFTLFYYQKGDFKYEFNAYLNLNLSGNNLVHDSIKKFKDSNFCQFTKKLLFIQK